MDTERKANQPVNADSSDEDIIDRARELHEVDGEVELDIDAEVSRCETDPEGAYVQAWVWVPFEEEEVSADDPRRCLFNACSLTGTAHLIGECH